MERRREEGREKRERERTSLDGEVMYMDKVDTVEKQNEEGRGKGRRGEEKKGKKVEV